MAGNNYSMLAMMSQQQAGIAGVPTQTFNGSNILGTPVPVVGDQKGNMPLSGAVGNAVLSSHVVFIAVAIVVLGYLLFHINFER